jgi:hypothetical protein
MITVPEENDAMTAPQIRPAILRLAALGLATAISIPTLGAPPSTAPDGTVAYIDQITPSGARLAEIASIVRHGKNFPIPDTDSPFALLPGDQICIARPGAALTVRKLATNEIVPVRQTVQRSACGLKDPDFTIQQPALSGLPGAVAAWFLEMLRGADQGGGGSALAASRAVRPGTCYNETGKTNEPNTFRIPILAASRSVLAAGNRAIFLSWQGGAQPFSVTLSAAGTGRIVSQVVSVRNACAVHLPQIDLQPGRYQLAVTDANNVKEEEDSLFVATEVPAEPHELRDTNLPEEARQLYTATWLAVQDGGIWAFEAQQRVVAMDCRSAAVQDWLRQWGGSPACGVVGR